MEGSRQNDKKMFMEKDLLKPSMICYNLRYIILFLSLSNLDQLHFMKIISLALSIAVDITSCAVTREIYDVDSVRNRKIK